MAGGNGARAVLTAVPDGCIAEEDDVCKPFLESRVLLPLFLDWSDFKPAARRSVTDAFQTQRRARGW